MNEHSSHAHSGGCNEYRQLSRRNFLAGTALAALATQTQGWLPRVSFAKDYRSAQRDVIISIYLRGASDGLSMCVPYGDGAYYSARPTLAVARPDDMARPAAERAINLNGFFGLSPAMAPLLPAYQGGRLAFIQACGSHDPTRSHFDGQRYMEVGKSQDATLNSGWLGRHVASQPPMDALATLRAVGLSTGLQRTLVGAPLSLPISDLDRFGLLGNSGSMTSRRSALSDMFAQTGNPLAAAASTTIATIDALNTINFLGYVPAGGASYNITTFGYSLKTSAALIKAQMGVEAIAIDIGGWDTHSTQGVFTGSMANAMSMLSTQLAAFDLDMSSTPNAPGYTVIVMSEFGRRVAENASQGTDHGHGNMMMVLGGCVNGGRVVGTWPGLATEQRYDGLDLAVTTDYRDIIWEVLNRRAGATNPAVVFPGHTPVSRNVLLC